MKRSSQEERVRSKIRPEPISGCRLWTGCVSREGYGQVYFDGRKQPAHRAVYEMEVGPIPHGMVLDHLCRVRRCVNPEHLEPVTNAENVRRGEGLSAKRARQTHCLHGHEFTEANTHRPKRGGRRCRACNRDRCRRYYARRAAR